jgi:hypothetical protein
MPRNIRRPSYTSDFRCHTSIFPLLFYHPTGSLFTMKFTSAATAMFLSSFVTQSMAFGIRRVPAIGATTISVARRPFTSSTPCYMANVLKLSDPQPQLLDQVDVFIFDCDGVIWRVRFGMRSSLSFLSFCFCVSQPSLPIEIVYVPCFGHNPSAG